MFAAAARAVDDKAAAAVERERNWRFGYGAHVVKNLQLCARSEAAAVKVAQAGLAKLYETFDFVRADGSVVKVAEAIKTEKGSFETHTIRGTRARPVKPEVMPGPGPGSASPGPASPGPCLGRS